METLQKIKESTSQMMVEGEKFYKGNKSAGTRARKLAQELKALLQQFRTEVIQHSKSEKDA